MIKLNLNTNSKDQEIIKNYLENNVSEILANKINNGIKIVKENKTLINKKDLDGFMKYASDEARKLANNKNYACIEDNVVFGWAIHYFEEDSIEGKLFNEDGTEFKPVVKQTYTPPKVEVKPQVKKENTQQSLFDFLNTPNSSENNTKTEQNEDNEEEDEEIEENEIEANNEVKTDYPEYYKTYLKAQQDNPNSVVITKLGDFFEAYNENANIISKELGLMKTSRTFNNEKIDMAGFPIHTFDKNVSKIRENYYLTIIENGDINTFPPKEQNIAQKDNLLIDMTTGEVISKENNTFDKFQLETIFSLFDKKVKIQYGENKK